MARISHVKKAQQRYAQVPVIDPSTGEQKVTPVVSRRTGEQKKTKSGKPIVKRITRKDTSKPLPMPTCDYCGEEIKVGTAYKHITPKSGPYGGRTRYRHAEHPSWQVWDYSSSLSARIAQIEHGFDEAVSAAEYEDAVTDALSSAADEVRSLAEEKREGASNIEEGFGHATYQSEELEQQADDLDSWADDIEGAEVPARADYPCENCQGDGEAECDNCGGTGKVDDDDNEEPTTCTECDGVGTVDCQECDEDHSDVDAWRQAVEDEVTVMQECPV